MSINVFLADDNQGFRQALRTLLSMEPDLAIVGEASNGRDAVIEVVRHRPDVAVLDIIMPGLDGIEATRQICQSAPTVRVLILSMVAIDPYVQRAFAAGARGYLLKELAGNELAAAIRTLYAGLPFIRTQTV